MLGVGGFGIVYLASDHSLEREVALKEYMPASLAARGAGPQITVRSSSFAETYAIGLRSFVNEARLLARFDHPSLVKVYRFWEDNATAYMVMPFLQGVDAARHAPRAWRIRPTRPGSAASSRRSCSALELLHREGVYHRDIAPDNILLPRDGPPVLLDFGAARRVISDRTQSLTAILKPSYAPIEQYAEMTQLRQGPWTDLYALGAVIHYLLFGAPPAPATRARRPGRCRRDREPRSSPACRRASSRPCRGCSRCGRTSGRRAASSCARCSTATPRFRRAAGRGSRFRRTSPCRACRRRRRIRRRSRPVRPIVRRSRPRRRHQVNTAHIPTHMPTAQVPPPGQTRAPAATTFSPTAQMPTARPPQQTTEFDPSLAPRGPTVPRRRRCRRRRRAPRSDAGPSQWPASRPATLPPPLPPAPHSRPAPLAAQPQAEPARSRPAPLPAAAAIPGRQDRRQSRPG